MIYTSVRWTVRSFVLIISVIILISGCKPSAETPPKTTGAGIVPEKLETDATNGKSPALPVLESGEQTAVRPYLDGWDKPAIALLLTGEQHGYLEPCGCSETQSGGMARRADLVRIITQEKGWELIGLDVGGTLKRSRRQDQIKFEKLIEGFQKLQYSAIGVGLEELKLGADFILTRMPGSSEELANAVALVSANVVLFDQPDLGWPLRYRLIEKSGLKIGVTSVFGSSLRDRVAPVGVNTNITLLEPDDVLPGVIKSLEDSKPDLMVLLCHGNEQESLNLAKAYPQFRIVLAAGGFDEPDGKPIAVGESWVLNVGHKGKRVGILGFYPDNAAQPFRFELIQLDKDRFKNHPEMRELMKQYQQQLEDEGISVSDELLLKHSSGQTFVGAAKCGECHTKAFAHWKETGHGVAFTTLKEGPWHENRAAEKIDWIPRQFDPECLSCHITGWHPQEMLRYESGYINEKSSAHLLGQQCENCHGPGSMHVAREENSTNMDELLEGRQMVRRTLADAKKSMCIECHDSDNSPKFTPERFDEFWEQVAHPFKD